MQWIYGLFLDLMSYCANALLGVMSTDLDFFEDSVPVVPALYRIFVAIGWGMLIGNCAFQCMKAMFAGFGFETESPVILLLRTFLFGFLLIFSMDICEIGLSIGKNVIDLLGIPTSVTLSLPTDSMFTGTGSSWLLVIIIGFVLGFQLIKLFFEIAERYVVVAVLTMLCPVGLAFGGSKSTKDICVGFIRTYASMIVMMVMNVLFLKLILSALATMPSGAMVLPWCLLVVGIAKTARKADQLISRIGLNPAATGDPLGTGRGLVTAAMAARTIMAVAGKGGGSRMSGGSKGGSTGGSAGGAGKTGGTTTNNSTRSFGGNTGTNVHNAKGGTNVGGSSVGGTNVGGNRMAAGAAYGATIDSSASSQRNNTSSTMGGSRTVTNSQSGSTVRFGSSSYSGGSRSAGADSGKTRFGSSGKAQVNTNRFGSQPGMGHPGGNAGTGGTQTGKGKGTDPAAAPRQNTAKMQNGQSGKAGKNAQSPGTAGNTTAKAGGKQVRGGAGSAAAQKAPKGASKQNQRNATQTATNDAKKTRFGGKNTGGARHNANPTEIGTKAGMPQIGTVRMTPSGAKNTARPDAVEKTDTAKEVIQDAGRTATAPKEGEDDG